MFYWTFYDTKSWLTPGGCACQPQSDSSDRWNCTILSIEKLSKECCKMVERTVDLSNEETNESDWLGSDGLEQGAARSYILKWMQKDYAVWLSLSQLWNNHFHRKSVDTRLLKVQDSSRGSPALNCSFALKWRSSCPDSWLNPLMSIPTTYPYGEYSSSPSKSFRDLLDLLVGRFI
jgi:hypothetical protein